MALGKPRSHFFVVCGALADEIGQFAELTVGGLCGWIILIPHLAAMTFSIQTEQLCHSFGNNRAVLDNLNLEVPRGSIYGFLGPNGAGKTTTIRLLLGLLQQQAGHIRVLGQSLRTHRIQLLQRTGSLVESPSLYGHLCAKDNLEVFRRVYNCSPNRIPEVLKLVGLPDVGRKRVSQFSLGMKQRLSIAVSLLPDPELLILDEPTNGLDPNGIVEMRELLRTLNRERGVTIFVSSHLLAEVERLVTHLGILQQGKLIFQGAMQQLLSRRQQSSRILLETNQPLQAMVLLKEMQITGSVENGQLVFPAVNETELAGLVRMLVARNIDVYQLARQRDDLETIFINLINTNE